MVSIAVGMMIMDNRKYLEETFIPYFKKFCRYIYLTQADENLFKP